jgi:hypothetical protein
VGNARAELQERAQENETTEDPTDTIRRVVADGITSQEVRHSLSSLPHKLQAAHALRRANKMSKRKQGRRAGHGWTVEELLRDSALASEGEYALAKKASLRNKLTSQVGQWPAAS